MKELAKMKFYGVDEMSRMIPSRNGDAASVGIVLLRFIDHVSGQVICLAVKEESRRGRRSAVKVLMSHDEDTAGKGPVG